MNNYLALLKILLANYFFMSMILAFISLTISSKYIKYLNRKLLKVRSNKAELVKKLKGEDENV